MTSLKEASDLISFVLMSLLVFFLLLDNILVFIVKARRPLIENKYFDFHRKYGYLRITCLKIIIVLFAVYALVEPVGKSGAVAAIAWAYGFFIIKLLIDFKKQDGQKQ